MRHTLILFLGLLFTSFAYAQSAEDAATPAEADRVAEIPDSVREAAARLVEKYSLDADQAIEALTIQVRKQRNLAEIAPLKQSNSPQYFNKLKSVQRGTQASIRRLLKTPEQRDLFQKTQVEQRYLRAEKQQALQAEGLSALAIEEAVLAIYFE
jgi:hypothetical protein